MNRKQKIIISVTGIFIVLLILVGLTYAYFLTRIQGNTNSKSISVTTADLKLTYGDGTNQILSSDTKLIPSNDAIGVKDFTVTNEGDDTSYVVVIEDVKILKASDGTTTTFNSNDFRYTLTCTKSDGSSCDGVSTQTVLPLTKGVLVGNSITAGDVHTYKLTVWYIETNTDQSEDMGKTLEAKVNITNMESVNPYSANTNSLAYNIIENARTKANGTELLASPKTKVAEEIAKIKINKLATAEDGFYKWNDLTYGNTRDEADSGTNTVSGSDSLTICNSMKGKHVSDASNCNYDCDYIGKVIDCSDEGVPIINVPLVPETTLSVANDDYGISYYYRGNVTDNYINFAGMCWRIVRILGDGSTKLILEDQDEECSGSMNSNWDIPTTTGSTTKTGNFGYIEYAAKTLTASDGTQNESGLVVANYLNGNDLSMAKAFKNFQTGPLANYLDKLKSGDWCLDDVGYDTSLGIDNFLSSKEMLDSKIKGAIIRYDSWIRLNGSTKKPMFRCNGTIINKFADENNTIDMYVGTLTADETVYAGGKIGETNNNYYLINNLQTQNAVNFWTLSLSASFGTDKVISGGKSMDNSDVNSNLQFRPSIKLKNNIEITGGDGTKANPYKVS